MKDWADKATPRGGLGATEEQCTRIYSPTTTDLLYPTVDNRKSWVFGNKFQPVNEEGMKIKNAINHDHVI